MSVGRAPDEVQEVKRLGLFEEATTGSAKSNRFKGQGPRIGYHVDCHCVDVGRI